MGQMSGELSVALTASPALVIAINTVATMSTLRRSMASASVPPRNEQAMIGPSCARLNSPTCSDECVSRKIWNDDATRVSWRPKKDTS